MMTTLKRLSKLSIKTETEKLKENRLKKFSILINPKKMIRFGKNLLKISMKTVMGNYRLMNLKL
jgi:hypothetical protein